MTRNLATLALVLLGACAAPTADSPSAQAADRDAALQAQLDTLQAQMEQLLIQTRSNPQFLPGATIIPPLRVVPLPGQFDQELLEQKALIDALLVQAEAAVSPDFGPGFVSASPEITLGNVVGDVITLNVKSSNPIGGPTVHHYEIKKVDGEWVGSYVGSTEYL